MKKRIVSALLAAVMVAGLFGGCGGNKQSSVASSASPEATTSKTESTAAPESSAVATGDVVEIEFFQQKREAVDSFNALIEMFQEKNPNIKVTQNVVPDASTVLMTRAASNDMPDVMMHWPTDSQFISLVAGGQVLPLDDTGILDNVQASYVEALKMEDGHNYCMPFSCNFMGVFYDEDMFAEHNYETPTTWDEMIAIAEDIKSRGEVAFIFPDKDSWTISQLEGNISGKDRPDSTQFYQDLKDGKTTFQDDEISVDAWEKILQLHEYSQGDTLSLGYDQCISDFATGTGYMFIQGIWASSSIEAANPDKHINMFPMPNDSGDIAQPIGVDTGIALCAGRPDDKAEAAKQFVLFMSTTEAAQKYSDLDHSPSCIKGVEAVIPQGQGIVDILADKGALSTATLPAGFEETKRSKIQQPLMDGDINAYLTTLTEDFLAAAADEQ